VEGSDLALDISGPIIAVLRRNGLSCVCDRDTIRLLREYESRLFMSMISFCILGKCNERRYDKVTHLVDRIGDMMANTKVVSS